MRKRLRSMPRAKFIAQAMTRRLPLPARQPAGRRSLEQVENGGKTGLDGAGKSEQSVARW
ncbi:hypothetical protein ACFOLJ_14010 [Rugamonas sp. CCM 8940]|uniref:hypothetical protein n=1 Tax=Rugamonas sp. CCM 8940 TaxID=2765359 RepID=UPI0018F29805|nr:hypothetical protein [Rugamonas sp. CCM 8940]MBJ7311371.1 hypothetical protein [Rugamonas sp. CCM 8940]